MWVFEARICVAPLLFGLDIGPAVASVAEPVGRRVCCIP